MGKFTGRAVEADSLDGTRSMRDVVAASPGVPARRVLTAAFLGFALLEKFGRDRAAWAVLLALSLWRMRAILTGTEPPRG